MARYAEAASSRDADRYAALFTPDAVQVDPYPSGVHNGRDEIKAFITQSFDACEAMTSRSRSATRSPTRRPSASTSRSPSRAGPTMHIRGVEVFTVTDEGLISAVDAYWGEEDVTFSEAS